MDDDAFKQLERVIATGGPAAGFDFLVQRFREEKRYPLLFETRLMKKRLDLGLPPIQTEAGPEMSGQTRRAYDEAFVEAAREAGNLFLADGDIPRAWSYFRAIGESAPVAEAIENVEPREGIDPVIEIAFHERINPRKGFELILGQYGLCRAITFFEQYPESGTRQECIRLLVRTLHGELVQSLKQAIARREGQAPETRSVSELMAGRDWLFGQYDYYIDTSHLIAVIQHSVELRDSETLILAVNLAEYGKHLSPEFEFRIPPPFENVYLDHAVYLRGLLGEAPDAAVEHFRNKLVPNGDSAPAQVLVTLLARLGRYAEAIDVSLEHLRDLDPTQLACPSVVQLCQMAGDYRRLKALARQHGDLLHFAAAAVAG